MIFRLVTPSMTQAMPQALRPLERLRGILCYGYIGMLTLVFGFLCLPAVPFGPDVAGRCIRFWSRCVMAGLRVIGGLRLEVIGADRLPHGPAIVAANHQSMWETIALYALLPKTAIIFKHELMDVPVYGWWGVKAGNIVIDRSAGARAIRAVTRATATRLAAGAQIVIFPEGTRAQAGMRGALQPGVAGLYAAHQVPVIPVAHNSGRYWLHPGPAIRPGTVRLVIGEKLPPGLDRRAFLARLAEALDAGLARAEGTENIDKEIGEEAHKPA